MHVPSGCAAETRRPLRMLGALLLVASVAALASSLGGVHAESPQGSLDLHNYKGKVVYLDFWASWCAPCRLSFPYLNEKSNQYPDRDFVVIGVNVDHDQSKANHFLDDMGHNFPIVYDPKGAAASQYKIKAMPTSLLIDRSGHVRYSHLGFFPEKTSEYDHQIEELIHEKQ